MVDRAALAVDYRLLRFLLSKERHSLLQPPRRSQTAVPIKKAGQDSTSHKNRPFLNYVQKSRAEAYLSPFGVRSRRADSPIARYGPSEASVAAHGGFAHGAAIRSGAELIREKPLCKTISQGQARLREPCNLPIRDLAYTDGRHRRATLFVHIPSASAVRDRKRHFSECCPRPSRRSDVLPVRASPRTSAGVHPDALRKNRCGPNRCLRWRTR